MNKPTQPTPYEVKDGNKEGVFCFSTEDNVCYEITIIEASDILGSLPLYCVNLYVTNDNKCHIPNRTAITAINIIKEVLDEDRVLLYICDTANNRQFARNRLFDRWIRESSKSQYEKLEIKGNDIVGGFLIRRDNPLYSSYMEAIKRAIEEIDLDKE